MAMPVLACLCVLLLVLGGMWMGRHGLRRRFAVPGAVMEQLPGAVFVVDDQDRVIELNPQAEVLVSAVGTSSLPFLDPVSAGDFVLPVEGRDVELEVKLADLRSGDTDLGRAVIVRDVTTLNRARRELKQTRGRLREEMHTTDRLRRELVEQTLRDALTGLPNRRHLERTFKKHIEHAEELGEPFAVVIVDVDHLRSVNDLHGHAVGDDLLVAMSDFLAEQVRPDDLLARFGGEEFVAVLSGCDAFDAYNRVQTWVDDSATVAVRTTHVRVSRSISAGIAIYPSNGTTRDEILAAADLALSEAKSSGRQRVKLAEPSQNALAGWRRAPRHRAP